MPSIDIEAEQKWEEETENSIEQREQFKILVLLRYNLFNGLKDQARNAEATYLINEAREARNHTHRRVLKNIQLAWQSYQAAENRLPYLQRRSKYAKATAEAYTKQWGIRKRTLLDVLNTEAESISAAKDLLATEYDLLYSKYRVLGGTGQLVPELGVEYPEESKVEEP